MKMFMDNNKEYLEDLLVRMEHHSTAIEGNSIYVLKGFTHFRMEMDGQEGR